MDGPISPEVAKPAEIIIPPETARAFARGLSQQFAKPLETIEKGIESLNDIPAPFNRYVNLMRNGLRATTKFITDLAEAKQVKILPFPIGTEGWNFEFSPEEDQNPPLPPVPNTVVMDEPLAGKFVSAFNHRFRNPLSPVFGYAELLQVRATDEGIREKATAIHQSAGEINKFLDQLKGVKRIEIVTDEQGNTTINVIKEGTQPESA